MSTFADKIPFLPKEIVIGLDLGSASVKLAQITRHEGGFVLSRAESRPLPFTEDEAAREHALFEAITALIKNVPLEKAKVIVCFDSPETAMRVIRTPAIPKKELKEAIELEAKNYLPFPVNDSFLDFVVLREILDKGLKRFQIAVAASSKKTILQTFALLKKAGIKPAAMIPIPFAFQKLEEHSRTDSAKMRCRVDLGDRHSEVIIFQGKHLIFSRKIPVGARDFTKALTGVLVSDRGKLQLKWEEAEQVKREIGLPQAQEARIIGDKINTSQVLSMLRPLAERLADEIDRCLVYYREETGSEEIAGIELFGGGAGLKGLPQFLAQTLGIEVKVGDPVKRLKWEVQMVRPEEDFAMYATAIGCCMDSQAQINLMPPEAKQEIQRALRRSVILSAVSTAVCLLAFIYIGMKIQLGNFQKRIDVAQYELSSIGPELQRVEVQSQVSRILSPEPYWEDILKELSHAVPYGQIYLTQLKLEEGRLQIKGVAVAEEKERVLAEFIEALNRKILKNAKLVNARASEEKSGSEFELSAEVSSWN